MTEGKDDNFLSRWSRRKALVKQGEVAPPQAPAAAPVPAAQAVPAAPLLPAAPAAAAPLAQAPPPPTLDDVAQLTRESSFARFVAPDVDPGVRNAAMKKLFTDPHFNVMDGLDIYIDDYNKFEPIPKSMLRQMVQARALGLLDDELEEQPATDNAPAHHEDADLQLQPHDAAGQPGAEPGTVESVEPAGEPVVEPERGAAGPADELAHDPVPPRSP